MGFLVETDGSASEVRFAALHTVASRAVMWKLYGIEKMDKSVHYKYRDDYLLRASTNNLVKAFSSGMDVHKVGTGLILDKDPKDVTKAERTDGKTVTLGRIYNRQSKAIAAQYGIDFDIMDKRVRKWDSVFSEFKDVWHPAVGEFVRKKGFVTSLFNNVRRLPDIWSDDNFWSYKAGNEAINAPVQSDSHQWVTKAIGWMHTHFLDLSENKNVQALVVNDVHDALITDSSSKDLDIVVVHQVMSLLNPYFNKDEYPWICCDLACDLKLYHQTWGKCLGEFQFDTSRMENKGKFGFKLKEEVTRMWFGYKQKLIDEGKLKL